MDRVEWEGDRRIGHLEHYTCKEGRVAAIHIHLDYFTSNMSATTA